MDNIPEIYNNSLVEINRALNSKKAMKLINSIMLDDLTYGLSGYCFNEKTGEFRKATQRELNIAIHHPSTKWGKIENLDLKDFVKKGECIEVTVTRKKATDDELSFLEGVDTTETQNSLRFKILKDVYLTKKDARDAAALDYEKKQRNQRIAELIAKKKEEALESKSIEELEKMLEE